MTPQWNQACKICTGAKDKKSEKDCGEAMVNAEQNAIEDCEKEQCGLFPVNDVPMAGDPHVPPGFPGDFNDINDRINYGNKRCCGES